jgi:hypothetical protein
LIALASRPAVGSEDKYFLILFAVLVVSVPTVWILERRRRKRLKLQRGFEVKPITGDQTGAETKKDDHHG